MRRIIFAVAITCLFVSHLCAQPIRTDAHRAEAKQYRDRVQSELTKAARLLQGNPSDAEIGAESRKITSLMNDGKNLSDSVLQCKGLGAFAHAYWTFGLLHEYRRERNARQDSLRFKADYDEALAKCDQAITGPQLRFGN